MWLRKLKRTKSVGRQTSEEPMAVFNQEMRRVLAVKNEREMIFVNYWEGWQFRAWQMTWNGIEMNKSEMTLRFCFKVLNTSKIELHTPLQTQLLLLTCQTHPLSYRGFISSEVAFHNSLLPTWSICF